MTYPDALAYLYDLRVFGQKLGLDTIRRLLERLGNPQHSLSFIHIAGTNGKGSVAAMCQAGLTVAGRRSGLYTSPHLVSFRERMQVGPDLATRDEVAALVERIRPVLSDVASENDGRHPTFFEAVTAMALCYFKQQEVDIVVWETGLGGRLDATNVVTPAVSVITSIAIDHAEYLGSGLANIATEKCGIIKPGVPVVTCRQDPAAREVIERTCQARGCSLTTLGKDIIVESAETTARGQTIRISGVMTGDGIYEIPLAGGEQVMNGGLAIAALAACGIAAGPTALAGTRWPGRFQVVDGQPPVIVDGAHNPSAMRCLVANLQRRYPGRSIAVLFGMLADKAIDEVCGLLAPLVDAVCCVPVRNDRTASADDLARSLVAGEPCPTVTTATDAMAGLAMLRGGGYDVILVTGSLFLAGEVLAEIAPPYGVEPD